MPNGRESCKPPMKTEAPWAASVNEVGSPQTTYYSAFCSGDRRQLPRQPIRPTAQHPWLSDEPMSTRSTAHDAYQYMKQPPRESFKPKRQFEPNPWMQKPTTTQMASFLPPINHQRAMPFRPKGQVYDPSPFNTTSTAQDAFQAWPVGYRPRPAIYPEEKPYIYEKFECESTSRAAYRAYQVKGYVPAPKPINAMGLDGMF
jgi:hypothetical protein